VNALEYIKSSNLFSKFEEQKVYLFEDNEKTRKFFTEVYKGMEKNKKSKDDFIKVCNEIKKKLPTYGFQVDL